MKNIFIISITISIILVLAVFFFLLPRLDYMGEYDHCKSLPANDSVDSPYPSHRSLSSQSECLYELAIKYSNTGLCDEIDYSPYPAIRNHFLCVFQIAYSHQDKDACLKLANETEKEGCLVYYEYFMNESESQYIQKNDGKSKRD